MTSKQHWFVITLCCAAMIVGCDDDDPKENTGGEMGGMTGGTAGEMGGVTGGEMGGVTGGEMGGVTGGEMGGEMGGAVVPARYTVAYGSFATLNEGDPAVMGTAQLVRDLEGGSSHAQVYAYGLTPETAYNVHVHALPCEFAGGGHYVLDPSVEGVVEENEVWPSFTTSAEGVGRADVSVDSLLRGDAMSVVIHNPEGGAKLACADLLLSASGSVEFKGSFAPFEGGDELDAMIAGDVTVTVGADSTLDVNLNGLVADTEYKAHVHALPCAVNQGGGHYKIDPTVAETLAENEVWPSVEPVDGSSSTSLTTLHVLRADAQSIVIHRVTADGSPKVACADLTRQSYEPATRGATSPIVYLSEAGELANTAMGSATLEINTAGRSTVSVSVTGFDPELSYSAHLHNEVCEISQGGAHYLIDPSVTETIESNELWPSFTTDAEGVAEVSVYADHVVRPEAQSVVIHGNGGRVACLPLY